MNLPPSKKRNRWLWIGIAIASVIWLTRASQSVVRLYTNAEIVQQREAELKRLEEEQQSLKHELGKVARPDYVEKMAREKLGFVREGEARIIFPESETAAAPSIGEAFVRVSNRSEWLRLFFY